LIENVPPPFAVTLRQSFTVRRMFSAHGTLRAKASLNVDGAFQFGYDGGWSPVKPTIKPTASVIESIHGVSVGANGLVLAHKARLIVGIGAAGFVAGPYIGVNTALGTSLGSRIGISRHAALPADKEACRGSTVIMNLVGGIGYSIPSVVANAVNGFLALLGNLLRTKIPKIEDQGGEEMPLFELYKHQEIQPSARYCHGELGLDQTR
jgi:hypothetical protein